MLRWGMIGCGRICHRIMNGFHNSDCNVVSAVYGRTRSKVEAFAYQYHISNVYSDFDKFLHSGTFDIAYVAVPHTEHESYVVRALNAGIPVICEKPMAPNAAGARRMVEAAIKNNTFLMEGMWTRMFPTTQKVLEWLPQIGRIVAVQASFGFQAGPATLSDRLFNPDQAGGALLDIGIYPLSYMSMLLREQPSRIATIAKIGTTGCDETSSFIFEYPNGTQASIMISFCTEMKDVLTIYGSKGYIIVHPDFWRPKKATLSLSNYVEEYVDNEFLGEGFQFEIEHVRQCLQDGLTQSPLISLNESIQILETADKIRSIWNMYYPFE